MNENQLLDRRIQRTRQLLHEALFSLIVERGYESITVQDITERANLGRTTFYLHYRDKAELLQESVSTLLYALRLDVEPDAAETCTFQVLSIRVFQHIARRQQLYQAILKDAVLTSTFWNGMRSYISELCLRFLPDGLLTPNGSLSMDGEIFAAHATGSLFGLVCWWLYHDTNPSAEQMGTTYCRLMLQENNGILQDYS